MRMVVAMFMLVMMRMAAGVRVFVKVHSARAFVNTVFVLVRMSVVVVVVMAGQLLSAGRRGP